MKVLLDISEHAYQKIQEEGTYTYDLTPSKITPVSEKGLTKEQILAVRAMMYAFNKYGANRLIESIYTINAFTKDEVSIGFGEAYNVCQEMIDTENEENQDDK